MQWLDEEVREDGGLLAIDRDLRVLKVDADGNEVVIHEPDQPDVTVATIVQGRE